MRIFIQTPFGTMIALNVESTDTINGIKAELQDKFGYPPHRDKLLFNDMELEGYKTLADLNVREGSILNLAARPPSLPMPTVRAGDSGDPVLDLQWMLTVLGYSPGKIDSYFGSNTLRALKDFQGLNNLAADGVAGPLTWAALTSDSAVIGPNKPTLRPGDEGDAVFELQDLLTKRGFLSGYNNGVYDGRTESAVIRFQKSHGLRQDGVVGAKTWHVLLSEVAVPPVITASSGGGRWQQGALMLFLLMLMR